MRPTCVIHAVWRHFILVPSTSFFQVLWSVLWLRHQFVTDMTAWLTNPNPSYSKNRKRKEKKTKNKIQKKQRENKNRVHRQWSWHGAWTIEYQAGQWFCRVWDIFWRVSLKAEWFRRTEPWQRLCYLLWNQEQRNIAHQQISDNAVGPQRFQFWEYSVTHWDLQQSCGLRRKQYCVQGKQWCSGDIPY